jgi:predicted ATPase/DNA-binding winged helix-turn-helix (wHTH) protein/energy-coupling factor transporter ATP-binding protein EcfA2
MRYLFGDYTLDTQRYELRRAEQRMALEPKAFDLLLYLVEHRERVVGRDELLDRVWPEQFISDHSLTARLRAVRQVLDDDARQPRFIETVHGRGYRFIGLVYTTPEPDAAPDASPLPIMRQRPDHAEVGSATASAISMVGRKAEIAFLHQCFHRSRGEKRQVVFITGEAGLGKTTLVDAFVQEVEHTEPMWIGRGQCIEHYGLGEAYMPMLEALEQMCRSSDGREMIAVLAQQAPTWLVQMPWLISSADLDRLQPRTMGTTQERMLREIVRTLEVLSTEKPLLLVLEDLHWSDYSTLDLLAMLARRRESARLLVLGTYRPEEVMGQSHPLYTLTHELHIHGFCEILPLTFLTEAAVAAYLRVRLPEAPDLKSLARFIYRRTEGNPLFMANVVDDVMAQGELEEHGMPESLRQLLNQRLDRLNPDEQRLIEVGSVVGVEFAAAAVASVLAVEIDQVEACCEGLIRRGQWLQAREMERWPDGTVSGRYGFIHALYQEVVYERVTPGRRLHLHRLLGERLEAGYGAQARELAAELAVHFEHGQMYQKAVQYREQAAENAVQRSAYKEAVGHLTRGLGLLMRLPDSEERVRSELALQAILGPVLMATKGQGSPEVDATYTRAYALCQQVPDAPQHFPILRGLWNVHLFRGNHQIAQELGELLFELAQRQHNSAFLSWGYTVQGLVSFYRGAFSRAHEQFAQGLGLYDPEQYRAQALGFAQNPGVACQAFGAYALWFLGYPEQALRQGDAALTRARELPYAFHQATALNFTSRLYHYCRDVQAALGRAETLMALASEHGFPVWLAQGQLQRGWALSMQGQSREGLLLLQEGLASWRASGSRLWLPYGLSLLAEAYGQMEQADAGLHTLAEALDLVEHHGERFYEAELHRLRGELLLHTDVGCRNTALTPEACFQKALDIARQQRAKSWELRAATSLARLWQSQGKRQEAYDLLAPVYEWFTEGFGTADLKEAKALLDELEG